MHKKALAVVAALSLALLGLWTITGTAARAAGSGTGQQIVVPAYFTDSSSWNAIDSATPNAMAIADVDNGPGNALNSTWQSVISTAHQRGVKVVGYVDTGYFGQADGRLTRLGDGSISAWLDQAEADVNEWYTLYGSDMGGIFFDDALNTCGTNNQYVDLYSQLTQYVKANHPGAVTLLNPGIDVPQCYANTADIIVRFENTYAAYQSFVPNSWMSGYDPRKFMEIIHDTPSGDLTSAISESKANGAGYVYVTDQAYNALPSYWSTEVSSVAAPSTGTPNTPSQPIARHVTGTSVMLTWPPVRSAAGYDVYHNGAFAGEATGPAFTATGLTPSTHYTFTVVARDLAADASAPSPGLVVETSPPGNPPSTPSQLSSAELLANGAELSWNASPGAAYYNVYENNTDLILTVPASYTSVRFDGLTANTSYTFSVQAVGVSGAKSGSTSLQVTTTDPATAISGASATVTSSTYTLSATFEYEYAFYMVCINSDDNIQTGYQATSTIGCDYLIQNGNLYQYAGTGGTDWAWTAMSDTPTESISYDSNGNASGLKVTWTINPTWLSPDDNPQTVMFIGDGYQASDGYSGLLTVSQS